MLKVNFTAALFCLLLVPAAARAQSDVSQEEYQKMVQQAMKSGGNYGEAQAEGWDARLKVISGEVMVKTADSEEWSAITGLMPLDPNDSVKTASDGIAELYLDDKGAIAIGRNTELEISSLDQTDTVFTLDYGSLVAKVKHFLNEKFRLQVRTPSAVCAVRGTEFAVEYSKLGKDTSVAVFDEGRVVVTPNLEAESSSGVASRASNSGATAQDYTLEKNTELSFGPSQKRFHPVPIARMSRYRGTLVTMRARVLALKGWKPRSAQRRAQLRDQALKRKVIRRQIGAGGEAATAPKARAKRGSKAKAAAAVKRAKAKRQAARKKAQADEPEEAP